MGYVQRVRYPRNTDFQDAGWQKTAVDIAALPPPDGGTQFAVDQLWRSERVRRPTVIYDGKRYIEREHSGGRGEQVVSAPIESFAPIEDFTDSFRTPGALRILRESVDPYGVWTGPATGFSDFFAADRSSPVHDFVRFGEQTRRTDQRQALPHYQTTFGDAPTSYVATVWDPAIFSGIAAYGQSFRTAHGPSGAWEHRHSTRPTPVTVYQLIEPDKLWHATLQLIRSDRTLARAIPARYFQDAFMFLYAPAIPPGGDARAPIEQFAGSFQAGRPPKLDVRLLTRQQHPAWQGAIPADDDPTVIASIGPLWQSYQTRPPSRSDVRRLSDPDLSWIRPTPFDAGWLTAIGHLASSFRTGPRVERDVRLRTTFDDAPWIYPAYVAAIFNPQNLPPLLELLGSERSRAAYRHVNQFSADFLAAWLEYAEFTNPTAEKRQDAPPGWRRSGSGFSSSSSP